MKEAALIDYLASRRWFGWKGRKVRGATIENEIPVAWPGSTTRYAVARARVTTDDGTATYQLFVTRGAAPTADALEDPDFRRGLVDAFHTGATFAHGNARWIVASESQEPLIVPPGAAITLASAEQSNSSVIVNKTAILKLYRRLEPGIQPDVEVARFLTVERSFVHVPALLGTIRFEDGAGPAGATRVTVAGMLQELVPGAVDAWQYALERSRDFFRATEGKDVKHPFEVEAQQIGAVTRALHEALASGDPGSDFDVRGVSAAEVRGWARRTVETMETALATLERALAANQLNEADEPAARTLAGRARHLTDRLVRLADDVGGDAGGNARTHGDYHLGQVLRSATGDFLVIDFEGEPARPLHERRQRHSPLRDVAGMLRSFAYLAAMGSGSSAVAGKTASAQPARAALWERTARDAFLRGYFTAAGASTGLLPRSSDAVSRLLSLFEAEKVFYELQYELDHRPEWVWIPLHGVAALLA